MPLAKVCSSVGAHINIKCCKIQSFSWLKHEVVLRNICNINAGVSPLTAVEVLLPLTPVSERSVLSSRSVILTSERCWKHHSVERSRLPEHFSVTSQHNRTVREGKEYSFQHPVLYIQNFWLFSQFVNRGGVLDFSYEGSHWTRRGAFQFQF